jgi:dipeptidyl aminopeptidase/acylaminoacyl peptidase
MAGPAGAEIPVRDFARHADYKDIKISPDGDYVATIKRLEDRDELQMIRLSDNEVTGKLELDIHSGIAEYGWVGPRRIVATIGRDISFFDRPQLTGELIGIDVDGKRRQYLFGINGIVRKDTRITIWNTLMFSRASLVDALPREPDWALIMVSAFGRDVPYHELYRLNVYTGEKRRVLASPSEHLEYYLTDTRGRVRFAAGAPPPQYRWKSFAWNPADDKWRAVQEGELAAAELFPLTYSERDDAVYYGSDEVTGDRLCLVRVDLASGKRSVVSCDEQQSLAGTLDSADKSTPIAALFEAGIPDIRIVNTELPEARVLDRLLKANPGMRLDNVTYALDGKRMVYRVYSDRDPGTYYIQDLPDGAPRKLLVTRPWIKPEEQAERRPVHFAARDGRVIHGYLTLPPGRDPKNLPMVVYPHGGPFYVRDNWEWTAEAELLANRGYAVLQVNFRGSMGYGNDHIDAGKKNWVGIVDDVTDGMRYIVQQGYADPDRLCIYGGSFGGYAALMSVVREPDAYKCAIDFAGLYDMRWFMALSDVGQTQHGEDYMAEFIGDTPELQKAQSPSTYIDNLKAPIMIVQGGNDQRVPPSQARLLRAALKARNHPYEWLFKWWEWHGFYKEDNRVEFYEKMLAFLDKYIGPGAPPPPAK